MGPAAQRWPLRVGRQPPHPRAQRVRSTGPLQQGRVMSPGAGDWGLGPSIGNIRQEDTPSAVHPGKGSYQRNLSLKKSQFRNPGTVRHNVYFTVPEAPLLWWGVG